ncbi:LURP-one-related_family protein [Hexamita inflata]|uniref:LURP-one-related family protein n=1 Tax=Hexamita inflata TaxID=28002 RepID=A0AA86UI27_9EUKA|nr:LURP-one-related family protein [Hexamita inflata]CAI9959020.1 LURP-one-related family protein [Hexamita inflata]
MQEKMFGFQTEFFIKNQAGQDCFIVFSKLFSFTQKHSLLNVLRQEILSVENKVFSWLPTFYVKQNEQLSLTIKQECSCFSQQLTITGLKNWKVVGDYFAHDFQIFENGQVVARMSKAWFTWGDSFLIEVYNNTQPEYVIAVVMGIHRIIEKNRKNVGFGF